MDSPTSSSGQFSDALPRCLRRAVVARNFFRSFVWLLPIYIGGFQFRVALLATYYFIQQLSKFPAAVVTGAKIKVL